MPDYNPNEPLPESGMGGASDAGAHGKHPASAKLDPATAGPENAPGDPAVERRQRLDQNYSGPERRLARRRGSRARD